MRDYDEMLQIRKMVAVGALVALLWRRVRAGTDHDVIKPTSA